ncbi:thermonuclease family protein [Sediminicola arcticus]|uniref:Thermonuclease family protein n=1 Tax=Sediminicola arcticus TaxID=1574308 RepID=A0ABV2SPQ5_9FLAO
MNKLILIIIILSWCTSCNRHRPVSKVESVFVSSSEENTKSENKTTSSDIEKITFQAKIIRILDGDTVEILYDKLPIKLRLEHIDAPEKRGKQPYGNAAKLALSDLCYGQMATISSDGDFDRNGRLIGEIYNIDGINVNKEMVRLGMAWHFKKYSDDMSYDVLEREARGSKIGLWQEKQPIAPWDFR